MKISSSCLIWCLLNALTMLCLKFEWFTVHIKSLWFSCTTCSPSTFPLHMLTPLTGNACSLNPCNTNGQCTPTTSGYTCSCFVGWDGVNCDQGKCSTTNYFLWMFKVDGPIFAEIIFVNLFFSEHILTYDAVSKWNIFKNLHIKEIWFIIIHCS